MPDMQRHWILGDSGWRHELDGNLDIVAVFHCVYCEKRCDFVWLGRDWLWESVSDPFVKHSYENAVVGGETKLVQYVFCAVFDIWEDGCGCVQWVWRRDFWTIYYFACVSEYTDRYYSICVWCMFHSVMSFLRIFRGLSCVSQPQVKEDQMLSLKSLSWLRYHGKLAFA